MVYNKYLEKVIVISGNNLEIRQYEITNTFLSNICYFITNIIISYDGILYLYDAIDTEKIYKLCKIEDKPSGLPTEEEDNSCYQFAKCRFIKPQFKNLNRRGLYTYVFVDVNSYLHLSAETWCNSKNKNIFKFNNIYLKFPSLQSLCKQSIKTNCEDIDELPLPDRLKLMLKE